ncbi:putative membrane protein [Mucilaginibacter yixingensis]|uniref:Putative membrane protein n=1 Tax=Mucilaginibacter yixingensis TaxID=1295612 RepID=A0A2T5J9X6_9SPHI|nr:SRPBCC family protein [Mucilaginibacter yixingensis]PTQ96865.1 putative membrane protein [Mucilaginibacter yixingensis]
MTTLAQRNAAVEPAHHQHTINLNWPERYVSIISGAKLSLSGLKHIFSKPFFSLVKIGTGGYLLSRGVTGHCPVYEMVGRNSTRPVQVNINTSVTVNKSRMEVYDFWRRLDNLPLFMTHLKSVDVLTEQQSRWSLKLPANVADVSWEAEIVYDEPGNVIVWQSMPDSVITNAGRVRFIDTPDPDITMVHVTITYLPPAGIVGASIAHLINPLFEKMVEDDITNFKRYMDIAHVTDVIILQEDEE